MTAREFWSTDGGLSQRKFIVIAPTLSEVDRYITALAKTWRRRSKSPIVDSIGSKRWHLSKLVEDGEHIVCTHALFGTLTKQIYRDIQRHEYVLVVDEEVEVVRSYGLAKAKVATLLEKEFVVRGPATSPAVVELQAMGRASFPVQVGHPSALRSGPSGSRQKWSPDRRAAE